MKQPSVLIVFSMVYLSFCAGPRIPNLGPIVDEKGTKSKRPVYIYVMTLAGQVRLGEQIAEEAESELIDRARKSDAAVADVAWGILVRAHQEHIFRLVYLMLYDPAEAEDVAQETFVSAFLALDSFETGRPFRPWLTRIAVNQARNRRRAAGRYLSQLRRLFGDRPEPGSQEVPGPEHAAEVHWRAGRLWAAVKGLSQIRQEVIYLRYFLDMSEAEMAEALDVPQGTVKSRLHRALAELRRIIEKDHLDLQAWFEGA